jgi:hypothetical protein
MRLKAGGLHNSTKRLSHVMPCYSQNTENPQAELRQHYQRWSEVMGWKWSELSGVKWSWSELSGNWLELMGVVRDDRGKRFGGNIWVFPYGMSPYSHLLEMVRIEWSWVKLSGVGQS